MFKRVRKVFGYFNPLSNAQKQLTQMSYEVEEAKAVIKNTLGFLRFRRHQLKQIKISFSKENYLEAKKIYKLKTPFFDDTVKIIKRDYLTELLQEYKRLTNDDELSIKLFIFNNTIPFSRSKTEVLIDNELIWDLMVEIIKIREVQNEI